MDSVKILLPSFVTKIACPLFIEAVAAGFPCTSQDYIDKSLDLNEHLIKHPAATFFVRVTGDSMIGAGIHNGDLLIVDKSLEAKDGSIIIAVINSEFTVKRLRKINGKFCLMPENQNYKPIEIHENGFEVWGVVTSVIHSTL